MWCMDLSYLNLLSHIYIQRLTEPSIISDITKIESHNCFIIHCSKENNKCIIAPNTVYFRQAVFLRELDTALGNHALRAQPTDYSLIC